MTRHDHLSTLREVFDRNVRLYPDRPAYFYEGAATTFRTYGERVYRLVAALEARGVRRQDRVAILAQNGPAYLEAYAACEVAGFILVPVNYRLAAAEVAMVGDNRHDMEMGRTAGCGACVGVLTGTSAAADLAPLATVVLDSIAALEAWLDGQPPA